MEDFMSNQIPVAHVRQYASNVFHLSQQRGSVLREAVRIESQQGKSKSFDRIGATAAQKRINRHGDTPQINTPHSRRTVYLSDYEWADLIDDQDKIRMIWSPESPYAQAGGYAMGRSMDDEIILAALGSSYSGEDGDVAVSLPTSQKVACFDGTTTTGVGLNVKTLRMVKRVFDTNEVFKERKRHFAVTAYQLYDLLGENEVQSADYNTIRALVQGDVDTFMGFKFHMTELLPRSATNVTYTVTNGVVGAGGGTIQASKSRRCFAWAQDAILLSVGKDIMARIGERADKSYSTQVYLCMSIGATRMEEEAVVEVICSEN
jgi:hypothetical protein